MKKNWLWDNSKGAFEGERVICDNWCSREIAWFETNASLQRATGWGWNEHPYDHLTCPPTWLEEKTRFLHSGLLTCFPSTPGTCVLARWKWGVRTKQYLKNALHWFINHQLFFTSHKVLNRSSLPPSYVRKQGAQWHRDFSEIRP